MNEPFISIENAEKQLAGSGSPFIELFKHGTLSVEFYKPDKVDLQKPHEKDEIYVVASGNGMFILGKKSWAFQAGDFLFVPAGAAHHFEKFSDDFATWVFFYGPKGGWYS